MEIRMFSRFPFQFSRFDWSQPRIQDGCCHFNQEALGSTFSCDKKYLIYLTILPFVLPGRPVCVYYVDWLALGKLLRFRSIVKVY